MVTVYQKCLHCLSPFKSEEHEKKHHCSKDCRHKHNGIKFHKIICIGCGKEFQGAYRETRKYCTNDCRKKTVKGRYREKNPKLDVCTGTIGAIGELKVCADMLLKGFEVYRAVSPSSPCDILVQKDGKMYRIEVTTGFYHSDGTYKYPYQKDDEETKQKYDILAVAMKDGKIFYKPDIL